MVNGCPGRPNTVTGYVVRNVRTNTRNSSKQQLSKTRMIPGIITIISWTGEVFKRTMDKEAKIFFVKMEIAANATAKEVADEIKRMALRSDIILRLFYSRVAESDIREVERTRKRKEIEDVREKALKAQAGEEDAYLPYEEGVIQSLEWVLGNRKESPLEEQDCRIFEEPQKKSKKDKRIIHNGKLGGR